MPAGPVESGYVAHQLLAGVYDGIPRLEPTDSDATHARAVFGLLQGEAGKQWARSGALRRREPGKMDGVLANLKKHSWETDAHLVSPCCSGLANPRCSELIQNPSRAEIDRTLGHLPRRADALLAASQAKEGGGKCKKEDKGGEEEGFSGLPAGFGFEDALVLAAARWFKHEYFRWADPIKCGCGGDTAYEGQGEPSAEDREGGAGRVELHNCKACGKDTRFPRYNTTKALMRARVGRCGESSIRDKGVAMKAG